jgi:hypothetical protein
MEVVGQLTSGIAYGFNNLLMVVGGNAALLGEKASGDVVRRRALAIMQAVERGIVEIAPDGGRPDDGRPRRTDREGVIEMAFGCGARVRVRGEVSSETLRQVIELLR